VARIVKRFADLVNPVHFPSRRRHPREKGRRFARSRRPFSSNRIPPAADQRKQSGDDAVVGVIGGGARLADAAAAGVNAGVADFSRKLGAPDDLLLMTRRF
jgi:hypothetical protein